MVFCANGQTKKAKKAKVEFENYAYQNAIESYESLVDDGYTDEQIFKNLGNANYLNAKYSEAATWYSKLFMLEDSEINADYIYRYAQSLKSTGEYTAADSWMHKFEAVKEEDLRAEKFADQPNYLEEIGKMSGRYVIENLAINSSESDFAPSLNGKNLIFSTARDTGTASRNIHQWTDKSFLNLYKATPNTNGEYLSSDKLPKSMNKKTHESSTAFTKDGTTVYFTRNNSQNGKFSRDKDGVSRLKIYQATIKGENWTNIIELPFNSDNHSAAHPALNADETKLYFASDMEGTLGESDLFVVDINSDKSFGTPKNLGDRINTESRETFPYITGKNILYFASDGHQGLGGLDIFATNIDNLENLKIVNIGKPVNSEEDDFSFVINETTQKGFFASNREGGKGSDDIYALTENEPIDFSCSTKVSGIVKDEVTGKPLTNVKVSIFNSQSEIIAETVSADDGSFSMDGDCNEDNYKLIASKEDYNDGDKMFRTIGANDTVGVEVVLDKTVEQAPVGTNLISFLDLEPIYFDLDKDIIRPDASKTMEKVIAYMKQFPGLKVQVQSHTDVKAGAGYNLDLSKRRAKNTVTYLIANGIEESRISGEGFGKNKLINGCTTRDGCPDERHQENRRSEFIVMEQK